MVEYIPGIPQVLLNMVPLDSAGRVVPVGCCPQYYHYFFQDTTLLRGTTVNRTCGTHKNLHIYLFLLTIFCPVYCGPP